MKKVELNKSEYLSKDILDEDFLVVFRPFRLFQFVLGSCRVDARHRFVTTPTRYQKFYTAAIILIIFISYSGIACYAYDRYRNFDYFFKLSLMSEIIFLFTSKVVIFVVTTFEYVLITVQNNGPDRLGLGILATLTLTDIIGLLLLCLRCELFERGIREVKLVSIKVMSVYHTGPLRDKAKKIYRAVEDTFPRFSVYDMWELDARLFIRVCNVVTGFFVTLLQFTYL
ncbi:uncharacterized protein LOC106131086 [Amyelois transitella]|uniref:uncharacterized protein LOC106131086 n=1 Tax=Amyelois transitella TaxID=680683 RepID=UPI0029904290|nr:uncharacterized protein LOC106131086 [Amyelois transitella]